MNRTYRLVWNRALRVLQVASELTRSPAGGGAAGDGCSNLPARRPLARACSVALALMVAGVALPAAYASPVTLSGSLIGVNGGDGGNGSSTAGGTAGSGGIPGTNDGGLGGYGVAGGSGLGSGGSGGAKTSGGLGGSGSYGGGAGGAGVVGAYAGSGSGGGGGAGGGLANNGVGGGGGGGYASIATGGAGGGGGGGALGIGISTDTSNSGYIRGGNGGNGGRYSFQKYGAAGGGGGGGGAAVRVTSAVTFTNTGFVRGGYGGTAGIYAGGGGGGAGVLMSAGGGLSNGGYIKGGRGGYGGGDGGAGVAVATIGSGYTTVNNTRLIAGGEAACAYSCPFGSWTKPGNGGDGLVSQGHLSLTNTGAIEGGNGGNGAFIAPIPFIFGSSTGGIGGTGLNAGGTGNDPNSSNSGVIMGGRGGRGGALAVGMYTGSTNTTTTTLSTYAGTGGAGGIGAALSGFTLTNNGEVVGGSGGNGGYAKYMGGRPLLTGSGYAGGAGGAGGLGMSLDNSSQVTNTAFIGGGSGGSGGYGYFGAGGAGGAGGTAVLANNSSQVTNGAYAELRGGYGGHGGEGYHATGGAGGVGGAGISLSNSSKATNNGYLIGGMGGFGGEGYYGTGGVGGAGGAGAALGTGSSLVNDNVLAGGEGGIGGRGYHGSGGAGGVGGSGATLDGASSLTNSARIYGGRGGDGKYGGYQGTGGAGGAGGNGVALVGASTLTNSGSIYGGTGGWGGRGYYSGSVAGAGGAGGSGAVLGGASSLTNSGSIYGGYGADGGDGRYSNGGAAGAGGAGAVLGSNATLTNTGHIYGGRGGNGGYGYYGNGGTGGAGGAGAVVGNATLTNSGQIYGGAGGAGGYAGSGYANGVAGAGGAGVVGTGGANVINSGTIGGGMSADGVQADAVDFSGGGNTLTLESGYKFVGNVVSTSGTTNGGDKLALGGSTNDSFDLSNVVSMATPYAGTTQFAGFNRFGKSGTSTWILSGSANFAGGTEVQAGTLLVGDSAHPDTTLGGVVTVDGGATLGGHGTVGGIDASGTVSPGGSIGTLHVTGDATFETGSTLLAEAAPDGSADLLDVAGKVDIKGGNVQVQAQAGNYPTYLTYTIINAGGGVNGQFASVSDNLPILDAVLTYQSDAVVLWLVRNDMTFAAAGQTRNQYATATGTTSAAVSAGFNSPLFLSLLLMDGPGANAAFDQLSGELHASQETARVDDSRYVREAMNQRLQQEGTGALDAWAHVWGHWGSVDGDGNAARMSDNGDGLLIGADLPIGAQGRVGFTGGSARNSLSVQDRNAWGRTTSTWLGVYGGFANGPLAFRGGLAYSWDEIPVNRQVEFTGVSQRLSSNATGHTLTGYIEGAWKIQTSAGEFEPYLNLAHVRLSTGTANEVGGDAALHVDSESENVSFSTLGARGKWQFGGTEVHGGIGWQHAFGDTTPQRTEQFVSGGDAFTVYGVPVAKNAAVVNFGADWKLTSNVKLDASYNGQWANSAKDQAAKLSLNVSF